MLASIERRFRPALAILCLVYFGLEWLYIDRLPIGMDEFQGAATLRQFGSAVPYVDFQPYKTVLGYYLQLPFLLLTDDGWKQVLYVKRGMAGITALGFFLAGVGLARHVRRDAVLLSMAATLSVNTFLEQSSVLRVDMLTSLAGLASFLWMLERRPVASGLAAGLSFLVSQKGAYFCVAGAVALGSHWLLVDRGRGRFLDACKFGAAAAGVGALYLVAWGIVASLPSVIERAITGPGEFALESKYTNLYRFWWQTMSRNPYFYAVSVLGIGVAFECALRERSFRDWIASTYAGAVFVLCVWHKQPWPYFFVLLIPTLWVVLAVFFERLGQHGRSWAFWMAFAGLGLVGPWTRVGDLLGRNHDYQYHSVRLAERLLAPGEGYFAGVDMLANHPQLPASLAWLDSRRLGWLKRGHTGRVMAELTKAPPKILLWNYRLSTLPWPIRSYFLSHYDHFWAAIWTYGPRVRTHGFRVAYAGRYRLDSDAPVSIDGVRREPGKEVRLGPEEHHASGIGFRLQWSVPKAIRGGLDRSFERQRDVFAGVYDDP